MSDLKKVLEKEKFYCLRSLLETTKGEMLAIFLLFLYISSFVIIYEAVCEGWIRCEEVTTAKFKLAPNTAFSWHVAQLPMPSLQARRGLTTGGEMHWRGNASEKQHFLKKH